MCNSRQHGTIENNIAESCPRQIQVECNANDRTSPDINVEMIVFFWRDGQGRLRPGTIVKVEKHIVKIKYRITIKTAAVHRFRSAPEMKGARESDSVEDADHPGKVITNPTQAVEPEAVIDPPVVVVRKHADHRQRF